MTDEKDSLNRSIYNPYQFSVMSLVGLTTIVALVSIRNSFWATVFACEMIAVHFFVAALVANLPSGILKGMYQNCLGPDGSFDQVRLGIEKKALRRLYWQILILCSLLFLIPVNWFIWNFKEQPVTSLIWILLWGLFACLLLLSGYIWLLKNTQKQTAARNEDYWMEDVAAPSKTPFDD